MDVERVEQSVLRCPLQELEFRHASGVYVLGNMPTKPAWWSVGYQAPGQLSWDWYTCRGLKTVLTLIEQVYPAFYAWLVVTFPDEGPIRGEKRKTDDGSRHGWGIRLAVSLGEEVCDDLA